MGRGKKAPLVKSLSMKMLQAVSLLFFWQPPSAALLSEPLILHVAVVVFFLCHAGISVELSLETSQLSLWQIQVIINFAIFYEHFLAFIAIGEMQEYFVRFLKLERVAQD